MGTRKLGIITCSNATQELDCCSIVCLADLHKRRGTFARYAAEENLRLSGIISCAGCLTAVYPEKILRKIKALLEFGINDIHFSNCMLDLCPFVKKYAAVISRHYPELRLVQGTHQDNISCQEFREQVKTALAGKQKMADIILGHL